MDYYSLTKEINNKTIGKNNYNCWKYKDIIFNRENTQVNFYLGPQFNHFDWFNHCYIKGFLLKENLIYVKTFHYYYYYCLLVEFNKHISLCYIYIYS